MSSSGSSRHPARLMLRYAPRTVTAAIALFSLLLTHQFIWTGFSNLTGQLTAPKLWLSTDLVKESVFDALGRKPQALTTSLEMVSVEVIAPPEAPAQLFLNSRRVYLPIQATGASKTTLSLRPGKNDIVAATTIDGSTTRNLVEVRYQAGAVGPTVIAWRPLPQPDGELPVVELLGLAQPDSELSLDRGPSQSPGTTKTDALGAFTFESALGRGGFVSTLGVLPPSGADGRFQTRAPEVALERQASFTIDEDTLTLKVSAHLHNLWMLRPYLLSTGDVLKRLYGLCFHPASRAFDFEVSTLLGTLLCFQQPGEPMRPDEEVVVEPDGRIEFERTLSLRDGGITARYQPEGHLAATLLHLPLDRIAVTTSSAGVIRMANRAYRQDGDERIWDATVAATGRSPYDSLLAGGELFTAGAAQSDKPSTPGGGERAGPAPADGNNDGRTFLINRIRTLEQLVPLRVRQVLARLISAIPFLYFLWILHSFTATPRPLVATLRAVTLTFLMLHLSVVAVDLFEASFGDRTLAVLRQAAGEGRWSEVVLVLRQASNLFPFLAIGIGLLARPVYKALRRAELRPRRRTPAVLRGTGWIVFWLFVVAAPVATLWLLAGVDSQGAVLAYAESLAFVLLIGLGTLWFVLLWLLRAVFRVAVRARHARRASWAMVLLPVLPLLADGTNELLRWVVATQAHVYPFMLPERLSPYAAPAVVVVLGAFLLRQTGTLAVRLGQHRGVYRWWRQHRGALLLAAVVLSIPAESNGGSVSTFSLFMFDLDRLLPYALLIGAVLLVRLYNPDDRFELPAGTMHVGALLFAWYVTRGSSTLLFIPVPFLIAWALFRSWLVVPGGAVPAAGLERLTAFLDERRARSRQESLQRGLDKKFSEGDLTLAQYNTRLTEGQAMLDASVARLADVAGSHDVRVFARGPESGPLENARVAVIYGLAISAPFQMLTLTRMVADRWGGGWFPLLEFSFALLYSVVTWGAMAAVFGYFFHAIRGRNGFEKALTFSLCVVVSALPLRLVQGQSLIERGQILDMVQIVAFTLVLALLAFDLRTLQKNRYGWRELMTVYGLASAAYGSTIAIALASVLGGSDILKRAWGWFSGSGS